MKMNLKLFMCNPLLSKAKKWLVFATVLSIFFFLTFSAIKFISASLKSNQEMAKAAAIIKLKTDMLSSSDTRVVVMGIALNYYPREQLELDKGGDKGIYPIKFYGIKLTDSQYTKLVNYFESIRRFPSIEFGLQDVLHRDYEPIKGAARTEWSDFWGRYWHPSGSNLVEKDGFVCLYPFAESKESGVWHPYSDQFTASAALVFRCAYFADPRENTPHTVAPFIANFLSSKEIAFIPKENIINNNIPDYLKDESFTIPNYSVNMGYNSRYKTLTDSLKKELHTELDNVAQYFRMASWKTIIEESTNTKLKNNWYSLVLNATNKLYECRVTIELWGDDYINYHPTQKEIRDKYPQYSDEEFEKNVLAGEIRRRINCWKVLVK